MPDTPWQKPEWQLASNAFPYTSLVPRLIANSYFLHSKAFLQIKKTAGDPHYRLRYNNYNNIICQQDNRVAVAKAILENDQSSIIIK